MSLAGISQALCSTRRLSGRPEFPFLGSPVLGTVLSFLHKLPSDMPCSLPQVTEGQLG